jgi:hemerythrin
MVRTEWTPALKIGIAEIDDQHRKLVDLLNEMQQLAADSNTTFQEVDDVFDQLELYIATHFRDEEALMVRIDYEFLVQHKQEHADLARQLVRHRKAFSQGGLKIQDFYEWFLRWFMKHIAGSDSLIAMFMSRNGITL